MARLANISFEHGELVEHNGGVNDLSASNVKTTYKRTGIYALQCPNGVGTEKYFSHTLPTTKQELYGRTALMLGSLADDEGAAPRFISFGDGNTSQISIGVETTTNKIKVYRGGTGALGQTNATLLATSSAVLAQWVWYLIHVYVKVASAGGIVEVRVDGAEDIDFSGDTAATANDYCNVLRMGIAGSQGYDFWLDDIAINDTTGSFENSWPGNGGFYLLKPTEPGAETSWTPVGAANNWDCVDEVPDDANTTYVSKNAVGNDTYILGDLPAQVTNIALVQARAMAALTEAGTEDLVVVIRHDGVAYSVGTEALSNVQPSYKLVQGNVVYEVLGGSGLWSVPQVNALESGVRVPV